MNKSEINKLIVKAFKELPLEEIEDRLEAYGKDSHLGSASERTWIKFVKWKDKFSSLLEDLK